MKKLRVGIIGLGVGEQHITGYQAHPQCEVAVLCDFDPGKLQEVGQRHPGIQLTREAGEVLADPGIDIVSIATWDNFHAEQVLAAIQHRKHIFVEKPLCLHLSEAKAIRTQLQANPALRLSSNLILRMSPRFRLLRQMIQNRELGNIFHMEGDYNYGRLHKLIEGWRGRLDFYSVVYGGGVHLIDLLLWLSGDRPTEVAAFGNNLSSRQTGFRYHDMVVSILRFASGMTGKMAVNFGCVMPHFHSLSVFGDHATFINRPGSAELYLSRQSDIPPQRIEAAYPGVRKGDLIDSFVESILNNSSAEVTEEDVFSAMSVCFAIEKAAYSAETVSVEYI